MDCTVHGILQARILEWVAFPFSRGSSQPRDQTQVSLSAGRFFTSGATGDPYELDLLLLSHVSCVRLCAAPQTAAHQTSPFLGFSRQERWSGLPFTSPVPEK